MDQTEELERLDLSDAGTESGNGKTKYHLPPPFQRKFPSGERDTLLAIEGLHRKRQTCIIAKIRLGNQQISHIRTTMGFWTTMDDTDLRTRIAKQAATIVAYMEKNAEAPTAETQGFKWLDKYDRAIVADLQDESVLNFVRAFYHAKKPMEKEQGRLGRLIAKQVSKLAIADWIEKPFNRGIGLAGVGMILGCALDLGDYATPAKLWKYLGIAVIDGKCQHLVRDPYEATQIQRYDPKKRAMLYTLQGGFLKSGKAEGTDYYRFYIEWKQHEMDKGVDKMYLGWADKRAQRKVIKRFLLNLWKEWHTVYELPMPGEWVEAVAGIDPEEYEMEMV